jgi:hypothetical protein
MSDRRRVEIDVFPPDSAIFAGADVTSAVVSIGPVQNSHTHIAFSRAHLMDGAVTLEPQSSTSERGGTIPDRWGTRPVEPSQSRTDTVSLSEIATLRRGVASGANAYFFLTDQQVEQWALTERDLVPALIKAPRMSVVEMNHGTFGALADSGTARWLFRPRSMNDISPAAVKYIAHGDEAGVPNGHLASRRRTWWMVENVPPADVLVSPMGGQRHPVILNTIGAVHSNSLYGIYVKQDSPWTANQIATYLRTDIGQRILRRASQQFSGGSHKLDVGDLKSILLPSRPPNGL